MKKLLTAILFLLIFIHINAQNNCLWIRYPSISPDGKLIVFSYKGDLYLVSSEGGNATILTKNSNYDYAPIWSPDSKNIAFSSDREGNFDIYTTDIFGSIPNRLTFNSANEKPTSFSSDGTEILFTATIQDNAENASFPKPYLSELYSIPANGGRISQILSSPAIDAKYNKDKTKIIYQNRKSGENIWRKHQKSSATSDIILFDFKTDKHSKLTTYNGDDLSPCFSDSEKEIYFISDKNSMSLNIFKIETSNSEKYIQITNFDKHPVRFLSISKQNTLCYTYNGELYIQKTQQTAQKLNIIIPSQDRENVNEFIKSNSGATEMNLSPDGKEIVFVLRGNIFVTSTDYGTTKQITNTTEQERFASFSPNGRAIIYTSERNGNRSIYETKIVNQNEKHFFSSTLLNEEMLLNCENDAFQPKYSPDGKEIAYYENRVLLKVFNLQTKLIRNIIEQSFTYSYVDGDQYFDWSPDGKYFLVQYSPNQLYSNDIALVASDGKSQPINLTNSGYSDQKPKWILNGTALIWFSDRNGYRSHGGSGALKDVYAMFSTKASYNKFKLSKQELEIEDVEEIKKDIDSNMITRSLTFNLPAPSFEINNFEDRIERLTINSSQISDAVFSPDGKKLYYLSKFEKGYDLWVNDFMENETKLVSKMNGNGGSLTIDVKGKNLFINSDGKIFKINTTDYTKKQITFNAEFSLNKELEREFIFNHVWRQMDKKFYKEGMHGVDWNFYRQEYAKFLPYIDNNYDFSDLMSEMLGELNVSHTGVYFNNNSDADKTASVGVLLDWNSKLSTGVKIAEILEKSPLSNLINKVENGEIIEKIDGNIIKTEKDFYSLLNRKEGKKIVITLFNPQNSKRHDEIIKAISQAEFNDLIYNRWVKAREAETDKISNGRIGYVHIQSMSGEDYNSLFSDLLGKNYNKEAIIIDTRYNGGGWLHDDLLTLLSGKKYVEYVQQEKTFGYDPANRWIKLSIVLVSEGNYSDAHAFPFAYKNLGVGKIVGMPVPGTSTAVWWETLQDNSLLFGIPQVGSRDMNSLFLENQQLDPDYEIENNYDILSKGIDQQLEKAVEVLLKDLDNK